MCARRAYLREISLTFFESFQILRRVGERQVFRRVAERSGPRMRKQLLGERVVEVAQEPPLLVLHDLPHEHVGPREDLERLGELLRRQVRP